jgi:hypothetical protein
MWGCFAPSRFNRQYAYALVFFLVLVTITGLAALLAEKRARTWSLAVFAALVLAALIIGVPDYYAFKGAYKMRRWATVQAHNEALKIRTKLPGVRRVLTFDALLAQEAGFDVYPEFAAGQFPWRLAHLIPADKRARFHLVGPAEIAAHLANDPPDAVLLGDDPQMEAPLAEFARARGFEHVNGKRGLWLAPTH